jgi:mutator protein MutT
MKSRLFARAIVINRHGKFLVVKNLARSRYEFPGGKQDPGETSANCAFRELREEVGIKANWGVTCGTAHLMVNSVNWVGDFWLVTDYAGRSRIKEPAKLADLRWVSLDELAGLPQIPRVCIDMARLASGLMETLYYRNMMGQARD